MRGLVEALSFGGMALGLHLTVFALGPGSEGGGAGEGGASSLSLQAASPETVALAQAWALPPEATRVAPPLRPLRAPAATAIEDGALAAPGESTPERAAPAAPERPGAPPPATLSALPGTRGMAPAASPGMGLAPLTPRAEIPAAPHKNASALAAPRQEAAPTLHTAPALPPVTAQAPLASPRPPARPPERPQERQAAQPAPAATSGTQAAPGQRASGTGGGDSAGQTARAAPRSAQDPGRTNRLVAQWGGGIRAAIERRVRVPRGGAAGTVRLRLSVDTRGRLAGVQVTGSSGHVALDRAALAAVRGARFPRAPGGLAAGRYSFNLPLSLRP